MSNDSLAQGVKTGRSVCDVLSTGRVGTCVLQDPSRHLGVFCGAAAQEPPNARAGASSSQSGFTGKGQGWVLQRGTS